MKKIGRENGLHNMKHANWIIGTKHPCARRIGKRIFPQIDPILPTIITILTAIALVFQRKIFILSYILKFQFGYLLYLTLKKLGT